jgi:hypothetical protein
LMTSLVTCNDNALYNILQSLSNQNLCNHKQYTSITSIQIKILLTLIAFACLLSISTLIQHDFQEKQPTNKQRKQGKAHEDVKPFHFP